jgi:hypothetical protein
MTVHPLPGFECWPTQHCITGALRHIYEFHAYPVSEEMLLGLGSGVGFLYWHMKGTEPFYGGRANVARPGVEGLEKTAGARTGVKVEVLRTNSPRKAEIALLEMVAAGEPVMIHVDMGFLPYLSLPEGYHFGQHAVVVAGLDAHSRKALLADRDGELHPVPMETLAQARSSQFKPFPPMHTWYSFDFTAARPTTADELRQAIREVIAGMLEPPIGNFGVQGIRTAAKRTLRWPEQMSDDQLRSACFNVFIFIDATGGTGGGIFRFMYGRFLQEAAQLTGETRLAAAGEQMHGIGDRWQQVAQIFREAYTAPDPASLLPEATRLMAAIAETEREAWANLRDIVGP